MPKKFSEYFSIERAEEYLYNYCQRFIAIKYNSNYNAEFYNLKQNEINELYCQMIDKNLLEQVCKCINYVNENQIGHLYFEKFFEIATQEKPLTDIFLELQTHKKLKPGPKPKTKQTNNNGLLS